MDKTLDEKKAELVRLRRTHEKAKNRWAAVYNKAHDHRAKSSKFNFLMREADNLDTIVQRLTGKINGMACFACENLEECCTCEEELCDECDRPLEDCDCCADCGQLHDDCDCWEEDEDE